ncbi:MAG: hypothetical protein AB7K09_24465 [Planctomycetota bacterium]
MTPPVDPLLAALDTAETVECLMQVASPAAMVDVLSRQPAVQLVADAIRTERLGEQQVHDAVSGWVAAFDPDSRQWFRHDAALAALAVALRNQPAPWAGCLLDDVATINSPTVPFAPHVAAACRRQARETPMLTVSATFGSNGAASDAEASAFANAADLLLRPRRVEVA